MSPLTQVSTTVRSVVAKFCTSVPNVFNRLKSIIYGVIVDSTDYIYNLGKSILSCFCIPVTNQTTVSKVVQTHPVSKEVLSVSSTCVSDPQLSYELPSLPNDDCDKSEDQIFIDKYSSQISCSSVGRSVVPQKQIVQHNSDASGQNIALIVVPKPMLSPAHPQIVDRIVQSAHIQVFSANSDQNKILRANTVSSPPLASRQINSNLTIVTTHIPVFPTNSDQNKILCPKTVSSPPLAVRSRDLNSTVLCKKKDLFSSLRRSIESVPFMLLSKSTQFLLSIFESVSGAFSVCPGFFYSAFMYFLSLCLVSLRHSFDNRAHVLRAYRYVFGDTGHELRKCLHFVPQFFSYIYVNK